MKQTTLIIIFFIVFLVPYPTYAYIDLGLGGQIFQLFYLIFFGIFAIVVSPILFFWKRIIGWIKKIRERWVGR